MKRVNIIELNDAIIEAQQLIEQAQELIDNAVAGTRLEGNYLAYGRYGFDQLLGNGNPYDSSLETLYNNEVQNREDEEEPDYDADEIHQLENRTRQFYNK